MDPLDKARESIDMNVVEKTFYGVPGIKGYKEKELRRETDKRVREVLAKQLEDQMTRLTALQADMVRSGQLDLLDDMEQVHTKFQRLVDTIRTASYGYAPLFDAVRVKEAELDALIAYDRALYTDTERIKTVLDGMAGLMGRPDQEWSEPLRSLRTTLDDLNNQFRHRSEVFLQTGPSLTTDVSTTTDLAEGS